MSHKRENPKKKKKVYFKVPSFSFTEYLLLCAFLRSFVFFFGQKSFIYIINIFDTYKDMYILAGNCQIITLCSHRGPHREAILPPSFVNKVSGEFLRSYCTRKIITYLLMQKVDIEYLLLFCFF